MGFFDSLDAELQKDLVDFVKESENNHKPREFKFFLVEGLLKDIVNGDREIGGMATNCETGDVFVKFSFTEDAMKEYLQNRAKGENK